MNGTTRRTTRSVQLAVMAAPSASLVDAVAESRRRPTAQEWTSAEPRAASTRVPTQVAA